MDCSMPGFPVHHQLLSLLKLMSIMLVMPSNHLILSHPLLLPSIFPRIRVFSNESFICIRWPKYWSFSFSIIPSKESPGLISFRMDWLDLLAVQGTLKSLLQHHSSKASIPWCSAFFTGHPSFSVVFLKKCSAVCEHMLQTSVSHSPQPCLLPSDDHTFSSNENTGRQGCYTDSLQI